MKLQSINRRLMLATAVAAAIFATGASAQNRVDNGNARDANNRIGSGGANTGGGSTNPYAVNGNSIVTGNVTGGREFRGFVPYTDPGAFRGNTAGTNIDRFVRSSAGVPIGVYNNNNAQNVLPFFGDSRAVAPPPGFVQQAPGQTAYVPALPTGRTTGDLRLGNPFDTIEVTQPRPGQLVLPGPVDASQQPTVITASPLYGIRQWKFGDQASEDFLQNYTDVYNGRRMSQFDAQTIDRMRSEIANQVEPPQIDPNNPNAPLDPNNPNANPNANQGMNAPLNSDINAPGQNGNGAGAGTDANQQGTNQLGTNQLSNQPLSTGMSNQALSNDIRMSPGMRNRVLGFTPTAAATSPQYRALQERLKRRQSNPQLAEMEANQRFRAEQMAMEEAEKGGGNNMPGALPDQQKQNAGANAPGGVLPGPGGAPAPGGVAAPGGAALPDATPTPTPAPGANQQVLPGVTETTPQPTTPVAGGGGDRPVMIKSFTTDMKDSAVVNLMKEAEQLMRDGKYTNALDKYDMAEQVVPNDPLVLLGRATAELGASYYSRADGHLREAFSKNPALLMGQYDLHTFLGDERLGFLVKDLKDLANKNKNDPRPVFLLSYIAYNTGNERNAAAYLDLAEKRAGAKDPFFPIIRKNWTLPEGGAPDLGPGAPDMNK